MIQREERDIVCLAQTKFLNIIILLYDYLAIQTSLECLDKLKIK